MREAERNLKLLSDYYRIRGSRNMRYLGQVVQSEKRHFIVTGYVPRKQV